MPEGFHIRADRVPSVYSMDDYLLWLRMSVSRHHPGTVTLHHRWQTAQKWSSKRGRFLDCRDAKLVERLGLALRHLGSTSGDRDLLPAVLPGGSSTAGPSSLSQVHPVDMGGVAQASVVPASVGRAYRAGGLGGPLMWFWVTFWHLRVLFWFRSCLLLCQP